MELREITIRRQYELSNGQKMDVNVKGTLGEKENVQTAEMMIKNLIEAGMRFARVSIPEQEVKRHVLATQEQWAELGQMVTEKTGLTDGDEMDNYVREQCKTTRLDLLTYAEVQRLIARLDT